VRSTVLILVVCAGCRFSVGAVPGNGAVGESDLADGPSDGAVVQDPDDLTATTMPDLVGDPCANPPPLMAGAVAAQCVIGHPPTIDGDLSDWPQAQFLAMTRATAAQASGWGAPSSSDDSNSSARFFVRWDLQNLYVAASVTDDAQETPNKPPGLSDNDALEIFLDGEHDRSSTYGPNDWQLVYSADGQMAAAQVTLVKWPKDAKQAWGGTSPSFTVEAAIPWSALGNAPAALGRVVGFDLKLDDNDQGNTTRDRDLIMYYVPATGGGTCSAPYCRTDVFGAVQLQGR